ncbi:PIN domain-containing protein [Skermania sp. ID1734]|uniref:TA system VapC family ribonuclease toxin n=1 Tax=Skermania sp. ID1734 TaxID=2597516 RepID=UPI00117D3A3A|nr:TA system VapC family ribonuclease toxin [Skermania sp. ID1734]TSD99298.1 PIN domain-containing protein [Skermania sp. ID1734]
MAETVDTNVLVYASNVDAPEFAIASDVVASVLRGPQLTTIFWPVVVTYLRIITHPAILPAPLSAAKAQANVDALMAAPSVRVVGEGERFWECYRSVGGGRGNDVPDAVIAALMHEHGVGTILTRDRDFRKYPGITVRDPFATP